MAIQFFKMAARSVSMLETPPPEARDIRKALFHSPKVPDISVSATTKTLMSALQIEQDTAVSLWQLKKDEHEKRLAELRKMQKELAEDNWRYPSVDSLKLH